VPDKRQPELYAAPPRSDASAAEPAPIEAFLTALSSPLTFLAHASPEAAGRTKLPSRHFAAQARALADHARDAEVRRDLQALSDALTAYDAAAADQRLTTVERCRALIERIRHSSQQEAPPYQRSSGDAADHLKALSQSAQFVRGVGPRFAEKFKKFGIGTVEDLLYHLPFRYEDRRSLSTIRQLRVGDVASVIGEISHLAERYVGRNQRRILEGVLRDDSGLLALTWYHQVAYVRSRYQVGQRCLVHG
jgi:hypothetical protein